MQLQGRHIWKQCFDKMSRMLMSLTFTRWAILGEDGGDDDDEDDDGIEDDDDGQLTHHQVGHILSLAPHTLAPALGIAKSEFITISMIQIS